MVSAGAESLAKAFDKMELMPSFQISLMICAAFARVIYGRYLI